MLSLRKLLALAVCATVLATVSTNASDAATPARRLRGEVAAADAKASTSFNFAELRAGSGQDKGGRPPHGSFDGSFGGHPPHGSFDGSHGGRPPHGSFDGSRPHGSRPHGSFDGSFGGHPPRGGRPSGSKPSGSGGEVRELDPEAAHGSFDGSRPSGRPPQGSFDGSRPHGRPHGSTDGSRPHGRPSHGRGSHAGSHTGSKRPSAGSKN